MSDSLEGLEAAARAATPSPGVWQARTMYSFCAGYDIADPEARVPHVTTDDAEYTIAVVGEDLLFEHRQPLADFIAAANPTAILDLIADRRKWEQRAKALWMRYHGAPLADDSDETWDAALTVRQD
jgi:hypothetical protein